MESSLKDKIEDALRTVYDPEIPVNVFDLGLVYGIEIAENNSVVVTMTLTAPACPAANEIIFDAESKVRAIDAVNDVRIHLTFDPPWNREMMSEEAKLELGWL